jgi:uncharacterized integral membrane protein
MVWLSGAMGYDGPPMGRKGANKSAVKGADKGGRGKSNKSSKAKRRGAGNRPVKPPVIRRIWTFIVNHPKGVLIGSATLLGLIVVFQNWRSTPAFLLVTDVSLPFIVWALIFMVVGYATGKWLEWAWRQRKIRKGTYKPRVSAEDLADTSAQLGGRLEAGADGDEGREGWEGGMEPRLEPGMEPGLEAEEDLDPATLIDRRARLPDRDRSAPRAAGAAAGAPADRWEEPAPGSGGGPEPRMSGGRARGRGRLPDRRPEGGGRPSGDWSPAAHQAAREGERGRRRPVRGEGSTGRYADYTDYGDAGSGARYADYADYGDAGSGARYADYGDVGPGARYADYGDAGAPGGRYADYADYGDAGSGARYADYGDAGAPGGRYADYADGGGGGSRRGPSSGPAPGPGSGGTRRR